MPKYLCRGSYSVEGLKGVLKDGGTKRLQATRQLIESMNGGTLESFYFAFGEDDFYLIVDGPDNIGALAATLIANSTGAVKIKTTVLLTPEEVDQATKISGVYRPPGQ